MSRNDRKSGGPGGPFEKKQKRRVVIRTSDINECWQAELGSVCAEEKQWGATPLEGARVYDRKELVQEAK